MSILAIHGQLGMESDWEGLKTKLAKKDYELNTVDLWDFLEGGGLSTDLKVFGQSFNENQDGEQIILGYSMGGRLALHALIDRPTKWKAAVIISTHAGLPKSEREGRCLQDMEWSEKAKNLPWSEFLEEWNEQGILRGGKVPDRTFLETRREAVSRSFQCWGLGEQDNLIGDLESLEIPILWVVGAEDDKFCKEGERVVRSLVNGKLLKIDEVGHRVPWEAEDELAEAIAQWIGDLV